MPNLQLRRWVSVALWSLSSLGAAAVSAQTLTVTVLDAAGQALPLAVVSVVEEAQTPVPTIAVMDQVDQLFQPFVLSVPVGATVRFPNSDNIRHQVYSFSPAKPFELPLYGNQQEVPELTFEQPGVVVLGCNIHDHMRAYIYVSPYRQSAQTDSAGQVQLELSGATQLSVWYPGLGEQPTAAKTVQIEADQKQLRVQLQIQPDGQQKPPPSPLQQRFNRRKSEGSGTP